MGFLIIISVEGMSLLQIGLMAVMLLIIIMGAIFGLSKGNIMWREGLIDFIEKLKHNATIKFERERLLRSVDVDDSFIKTN